MTFIEAMQVFGDYVADLLNDGVEFIGKVCREPEPPERRNEPEARERRAPRRRARRGNGEWLRPPQLAKWAAHVRRVAPCR